MRSNLLSGLLLVAAVSSGILAVNMVASGQHPTQTAYQNATCWSGDCVNVNWTNSPPRDPNGNPLPPGATCIRAIGQMLKICIIGENFTCIGENNSSLVCRGDFYDTNGMRIDCYFYAIRF